MLFSLTLCFLAVCSVRFWFSYKKRNFKRKKNCAITVGIFHPYCNAGGGGERVLWAAIRALQNRYEHICCIVYTGDKATSEEILRKVKIGFNIAFSKEIEFVFLKRRFLIEAKLYPYFTLLFQSLGSIILGFEALFKLVPDVYIDTMGYAFTLPIFKYLGCCRTACYVHYPTISTDMLDAVSKHKRAVNNRNFISNSRVLSCGKILYYKAFSVLYGFVGRRADVVMVNSSWTMGHILSLWKNKAKIFLVYPPCDVAEFKNIPLMRENGKSRILSIAQFRPEKDHELQIRAYNELLLKCSECERKHLQLVLVGSCRNEEDQLLVEHLRQLCEHLKISENVEFKINMPFKELLLEMQNADIALHTMWNEHFGIGIVECMSSGLIIIAHDSGGPKLDIVVEYNGRPTGFLAHDIQSYCSAMEGILKMSLEEQMELRKNARESVQRFSVTNFEKEFHDATAELFCGYE